MMRFCFAFLIAMLPLAATAHEFWIEPERYQVSPDDEIVAHIRVGEAFEGPPYSYNPRSFSRFDYVLENTVAPVPGRAGDRPAITMLAPEAGLLVLVHETNPLRLTYRSMEKFEKFLAHKDWDDLLTAHRARGLPEDRFEERYTRHVKSLVAVGHGQGSDQVMGLATEIVALANPYTDLGDTLPVQVWADGAPRAHAQVELFDKAPNGSVEISLHQTDGNGVAILPVRSGHSYLVDAVIVRAIEPSGTDPAVWESLWAGLTFAVP